MITTMFSTGRRLFTAASLLTLVVAVLHTYGMVQPIPVTLDSAVQGMQELSLDLGLGMQPSLWDIHRSLGFTMSITFTVMALLGLVLAATTEATSQVLSRTAAVMTTGCIALTALYWIYQVPPPLIYLAALSLCWGLAQRTTRLA